jgi:ATP-dependent Clp protease ATP-binding subunit ClpB
MTSNIGSQYLLDGNTPENRKLVEGELKAHFKPEFLNRIDDIVYFNSLDDSVVKKIVNKFINELERRLEKMELHLELDEKAMDTIISQGFDKVYGARPLKRYIQSQIETPLAKALVSGKIPQKTTIKVTYEGDQFVFQRK